MTNPKNFMKTVWKLPKDPKMMRELQQFEVDKQIILCEKALNKPLQEDDRLFLLDYIEVLNDVKDTTSSFKGGIKGSRKFFSRMRKLRKFAKEEERIAKIISYTPPEVLK